VPTSDFQATTSADDIKAQWWIEIEGIRRRYGTVSPSWAPTSDTGTNRIIRDWFTDLPEIKGQRAEPLDGTTEPHEFTVKIVDIDDELTALFSVHDATSRNETTLASAVSEGDGTITVDDGSVFSNNTDIYINRETMRITGIAGNVLTVSRGMYGSTDSDHPLTDSQGNTITVAVTNEPTFMHTREIILCENRTGLDEADAIKTRGYLSSIVEDNGIWELTASGYLRRLSCRIGETLAQTELETALWGGDNPDGEDSIIARAGMTTWCLDIADISKFQSSGHVIVDNEIIKYAAKATGLLKLVDSSDHVQEEALFWSAGRGVFSGVIFGPTKGMREIHEIWYDRNDNEMIDVQYVPALMESHDVGAQVREVIHSDSFTAGTAPAAVILTLLTSQEGDSSNGSYDVLPEGWGAGIDQARIDVTGIENTCAFLDSLDLAPFCIPEPVDCKEWLEENVLRPCLLFFVEDFDGKITVKRLYSKSEAIKYTTPTSITEDELLEIPHLSLDKMPIGEFTINVNWDPGNDKFWGKVNVYLGDATEKYLGTARNFEIDCKTIYDWRMTGGASRRSTSQGDLPVLMDSYLQPIWQNFAQNPNPEIEIEVPYNLMIDVGVGQVIQVTCSVTPDLKNSDRGLIAEYFQIVETMPQPDKSSIKCVAWMIGINEADTRALAPSLKVTSYQASGGNGDPRINVEDSEFADGDIYTYDVDAFSVGDKVILVDAQYIALSGSGVPEVAEIKAIGSGAGACWIDLNAAPTDTPSSGDYVDTASYDSCVSAQKADWAFLADATPTLGTAGDDPHKRDR